VSSVEALLAFIFGANTLVKRLEFSLANSPNRLIFSCSPFYISSASTIWERVRICGLKVEDF
jgi:hypothetical protein